MDLPRDTALVVQTPENKSGCLDQLVGGAEITYIWSNQQADEHHLLGVTESCSMFIHHCPHGYWLHCEQPSRMTKQLPISPPYPNCQEQTHPADSPMCLKMWSEDNFGFSDHVMRFHLLVGENVGDFKGLTHRSSSFCLLTWMKNILYLDHKQNIKSPKMTYQDNLKKSLKVRISNYSHKVHKKQATNPSVLEACILMHEA